MLNYFIKKDRCFFVSIVITAALTFFERPLLGIAFLAVCIGLTVKNPLLNAGLVVLGVLIYMPVQIGGMIAFSPEIYGWYTGFVFEVLVIVRTIIFFCLYLVIRDKAHALQKNTALYIARECAMMLLFTVSFVLTIFTGYALSNTLLLRLLPKFPSDFHTLSYGVFTGAYVIIAFLSCYILGWLAQYHALSLAWFNTGGLVIMLGMIYFSLPDLIPMPLRASREYNLLLWIALFCIPGLITVGIRKYLKK